MSPADRDVIRRKLDRIIKCLQRIRRAQDLTIDDYLADADLQSIMERQLELAIGAAVDLNIHLLVQSGFGTPADAYSSFTDLARHTPIITQKLAAALAPATGLRNRLVHEYDDVDPAMVYESLDLAVELFPEYVAAVEQYLTSLPDEGTAS